MLHLTLTLSPFSIPFSPHRAPLTFNPNTPVGVWSCGMAEGGMGTCPQVFVVDSQANYVSVPGGKKSRWARAGQKSLLLLVGLALSGLVVEGCFIYRLHKRTEVGLMSACDCVSDWSRSSWSTWMEIPFLENFPIFLYVTMRHAHWRTAEHDCAWVVICSLGYRSLMTSVSNGLAL